MTGIEITNESTYCSYLLIQMLKSMAGCWVLEFRAVEVDVIWSNFGLFWVLFLKYVSDKNN